MHQRRPEPEQVRLSWVEHPLPAPDGAPGRTVVRDAVQCGAGWWVVGSVFLDHPTETRDTRPAAWFSPDRVTWTSVPVDARTYWGRRAILGSIACSRGRIAVVGARSGGAHGNPRVTTFWLDDRTLVDVRTTFIQYGGVTATNVGPIAGGRDWQRVDLPFEPQTAGDHTLVVAAGEDLLLVADAGDGGHVWVGELVSS